MLRFLAGFSSATVLWGLFAWLYFHGQLAFLFPEESAQADDAQVLAANEPTLDKDSRQKRRRPKRVRSDGTPGDPNRPDTIGDDLDWDGQREVDMAGGEQQLSGAQIEAGFDGVMTRIRRCLVLVPADGEVTGKLIFGMRVGSDGKPKAVNLTGPSIVTAGESGGCLREAAQSIRFAAFQGPDMLFKYPITLQ